ncbi:MAG: polyprenyl synthetase family protein [Dehalococcoidia bacterium]|nr:MAG: polyprenyl synthetase family protein [Dehalococcoidia bacterium]
MQLNKVYKLVQQDLLKVEEQFRLLVDSQHGVFPELHSMLDQIIIGGKVIRPTLTLLAGKFYKYDLNSLLPMATASELLHIATLVHDDAVDKASIRRGRPTINNIWGSERAIILGDYLFAKAGEFAADTNNLRVVRLFAQTLGTISRAELRQGFSAFNLEQTFDDYIERIAGKTAALFAMATESGAVLSQAPEKAIERLKEFGYNLGIAFQIVDDILDFVSTEGEMGKPVGSDLIQGTITLPSLLLLKRYPESNPVKRLFDQESDKQRYVEQAIEMICNSDIIDECYRVASAYKIKACDNLDLLSDSPSRKALFALADYVVQRNR